MNFIFCTDLSTGSTNDVNQFFVVFFVYNMVEQSCGYLRLPQTGRSPVRFYRKVAYEILYVYSTGSV